MSVFNLRLFDMIWHHAHYTEKVFEEYEDHFFDDPDFLHRHIQQDGAWSICHNKYFGPFTDYSVGQLNRLVDFYKNTSVNSNFILINSFDFPELANIPHVYFYHFPEYHAYYYPLYQDYRITSTKLTKKFICLNKRGHSFRQALYQAFYNCHLLDASYFSYLCETGHCGQLFDETVHAKIEQELLDWHSRWPELARWTTPDKKFITVNDHDILDQYQDWSNQDGWANTTNLDPSWIHDSAMYATSFCSVVAESIPDQQRINLSEKTIRAFCMGHPIIMIGVAGTVEYLRNLGFDMFDDIIDHSYDHTIDPVIRTRQAFEQILKLNEYSIEELDDLNQQLVPRRQHNIDVVKTMYNNIPCAEFKIAQSIRTLLGIPDNEFHSLYTRYEAWKYDR